MEDENSTTNVTIIVTTKLKNVVPNIVYIYGSVFLIALCVVAIVANAVIFISTRYVRLWNHTLVITISLAGADSLSLFYCTLGLIFSSLLPRIYDENNPLIHWVRGSCFPLTIESFRISAIFTTLFNLCFMAFYHYVGVSSPLNTTTMSKRRLKLYLAALWTIPPPLIFVHVLFIHGKGLEICNSEFLTIQSFRGPYTIAFFVVLSLMVFIYLRIYVIASRSLSQLQNTSRDQNRREKSNKKNNKKRIVTSLMYLMSIMICWTPAFIHWILCCHDCLLHSWWQTGTYVEFIVIFLVNFLLIMKTATNTYLYAIRNKEIKEALIYMEGKLLQCIFPNYHSKWVQRHSVSNRTSSTRCHTQLSRSLSSPCPQLVVRASRTYSRTTLRGESYVTYSSPVSPLSDSLELKRCRSSYDRRERVASAEQKFQL